MNEAGHVSERLGGVKRLFSRSRWTPVVVICGLAALLLWPVLIGRIFLPLDIVPHLHPWRFSYERVAVNNPANSDIVQQVYPRRLITNAMLRAGAWPLWNPTILTGTPLLADGQMAVFYPPTLLLLVLPLERAFGYYALLQLVLAGGGTYLFGRQLKLGRGPATLAGICYMFSGYVLTWLQFPHHSGTMAMLPWCFWAVERATQHPWPGRWLLASVVLALPLVTQIQLAFYIYVGAGFYVLARMIEVGAWRPRVEIALGFSVAVLLACTLSAAQLLPQFALSAQGQRVEQVSEAGSGETQFTTLLRLGLPLIGGQPRTAAPAWGPQLLQVPVPYAGLAPLLLAVVALLWSGRAATTFFALLAVGSFALAVGSPLLPLFIALVPPYRQFADHSRWFLLWGFAIAVLAGVGAQVLFSRGSAATAPERRRLVLNRVLLALVVLFLAAWSWQHLALFTPQSRYGLYITAIRQQPWRVAIVLALAAAAAVALSRVRRVPRGLRWGVLLVVVAGDLLWYGGSYNTSTSPDVFKPTTDLLAALPGGEAEHRPGETLYPATRQIAFLQSQSGPFRFLAGDYPALLPNLAAAYGLEDVRGYQSLYLARYNRLARLIDGKDYTKLAGEGGTSFRPYLTSAYTHRRLLDMLNVRYILFPPGSENARLYQPLELVQQDDEGTVYRNPHALPRAWMVHQAEVLPDDDAQLARLAGSDFDPASQAVLPVAPPELGQPSGTDRVETPDYAPNQVRVRAHASAPGLLVLSDAYSPDWRATVDGRPATVFRANYALRAVWLPEGAHEVVFSYRPRSFQAGLAISGATLLFLLLYGLWSWRRERAPGGSAARHSLAPILAIRYHNYR